MKISLSWLKDFVDLGDRSPEVIGDVLTMKTALIEEIEWRGRELDAVVVARVLEKNRHPDADRLSVCVVDIGSDTVEVVCGAPNVDAGQLVPMVPAGATLPGGFKIKRSKIRGVTSNGMICSEKELLLGDDHDGILVLESGLEVGMPFIDVPGVSDVVFDIDNKSITHRPDLWGHEGFARELATIFDVPFRPARLREDLKPGKGPVEVTIKDEDLCGRYVALFASGPLGVDSPGWMQRRLMACDSRPLSLAVDVSNYVMLEIGQPNHPFDRRRIAGDILRIRRALPQETLVTLDGVERRLPDNSCVIADGESAVAIAGIMGGEASGIAPDTTDIVLESAWFDPTSVRRTSTVLGLRTDALARFEKFLDPAYAERGARRYAQLLEEVAPEARVAGTFVSAGSRSQAPVRVTLRPDRVRAKLGLQLPDAEIANVLRNLEFGVTVKGASMSVEVPSFRATRDVSNEDDLIEEVGRIHGYEKIEARLPHVACGPMKLDELLSNSRACARTLIDGFGFSEVFSYPYVDEAVLKRAGEPTDQPYLTLKNPMQATASRLRRSLVPWMLEFIDRNIREFESVRLFECGRAFRQEHAESELPYEPRLVCAAMAERVTRRSGLVLRRLKGVLDELSDRLGRRLACESGERAPAWAHPGRCARVRVGDRDVGLIAQVHPDVAETFGWHGEAAALELDLAAIQCEPAIEKPYRPPPKFPAARIDLSFLAPFSLRYSEVLEGVRATSDRLVSTEFIDEYTDKSMERGHRSLTMRLEYRAENGTLSDEEVAAEVAKARAWVEKHGAKMRG